MILDQINTLDKMVSKAETELVQKQKQEYFLLGTFLRTRNLILFGYNHTEDRLFKVEITYSNTIHLFNFGYGLVAIDLEAEKTTVDSRNTYFEALNMENAIRRVKRYKAGQIKELSNLRKPGEGIKFW
jgi:hypothetical protein